MTRFACEKILLGEGLSGLVAGCLQGAGIGAYTILAFGLPFGVAIGYWGLETDSKDKHANQDFVSMIIMGESLTGIMYGIGYGITNGIMAFLSKG